MYLRILSTRWQPFSAGVGITNTTAVKNYCFLKRMLYHGFWLAASTVASQSEGILENGHLPGPNLKYHDVSNPNPASQCVNELMEFLWKLSIDVTYVLGVDFGRIWILVPAWSPPYPLQPLGSGDPSTASPLQGNGQGERFGSTKAKWTLLRWCS